MTDDASHTERELRSLGGFFAVNGAELAQNSNCTRRLHQSGLFPLKAARVHVHTRNWWGSLAQNWEKKFVDASWAALAASFTLAGMRLHKMMRLQMWIPRISRCEGVGQGCMKILPGDNKRVVAVFPTVLVAVDAADPAAGQPLLPQPPLVVLQLLLRLTHLEKTAEWIRNLESLTSRPSRAARSSASSLRRRSSSSSPRSCSRLRCHYHDWLGDI